MNDGDVYQTKDLYESALLAASNLKLIKLVKETDFYWFVFDNKTRAEELSSKFWQGEALVNAKAYAESIRGLKNRIFARRG
jgi:hypothetical protein